MVKNHSDSKRCDYHSLKHRSISEVKNSELLHFIVLLYKRCWNLITLIFKENSSMSASGWDLPSWRELVLGNSLSSRQAPKKII